MAYRTQEFDSLELSRNKTDRALEPKKVEREKMSKINLPEISFEHQADVNPTLFFITFY